MGEPGGEQNSENFSSPAHYFPVTDLERSHAELRAALIIAGREIQKLNFGRKDSPVLVKLRDVLRESLKVATQAQRTARVKIG